MSHDSAIGLKSPSYYHSFGFNPLSSTDPRIQHPLQPKTDRTFYESNKRVQEPRPTSYQVPHSIDSVLETLHLEIGRHTQTQLTLQTSRKTNIQLEQLLFQERSFNHSLRIRVQDAEMKRIAAEEKLRAKEHQSLYKESSQSTPLSEYKSANEYQSLYNESSQFTPLSDYKSTTISPSIITLPNNTSDTSGGKRIANFTASVPSSKRLRSASLAALKSVGEELGERK